MKTFRETICVFFYPKHLSAEIDCFAFKATGGGQLVCGADHTHIIIGAYMCVCIFVFQASFNLSLIY